MHLMSHFLLLHTETRAISEFAFLCSGKFEVLESELVSSLKKSLQLKEDKLAALEARLQESSSLNQQLRQELRSVSHLPRFRTLTSSHVNCFLYLPQVKLSFEALQQRQEEESTSSTPPGESRRAMSQWLRESQEATKELLKLKDRLIQVERNVSHGLSLLLSGQ